jgi:hypothetical protein
MTMAYTFAGRPRLRKSECRIARIRFDPSRHRSNSGIDRVRSRAGFDVGSSQRPDTAGRDAGSGVGAITGSSVWFVAREDWARGPESPRRSLVLQPEDDLADRGVLGSVRVELASQQ